MALSVINCLKTALYPFLPHSSDRLHTMMGFTGNIKDQGWEWRPDMLRPFQALAVPRPLFVKLDESVIEQESERIGG